LKNGVFIVDEASMVNSGVQENTSFGSGDLLEDLIRFVFNSGENKLIFVGDIAQLPPVKQTLSPALNTDTLMRFFYPVETGNLTQVMRHKARSGIIRNATHIRQCLKSQSFDALKLTTSTDVLSISGNEIVERIEQSYDTVGVDETVIITRSNKAAVVYNKGVRQQVLWNENILDTGDSLVVVKNNYFWIDNSENTDFIANGDIIKVLEVNYYEELYGFRFADVVIGFTDYPDKEITVKILLESLESNTASLEYDKRKLLFEAVGKDYEHIRGRKKRYKAILDNPYFNALEVKYAYALTCHKAQGGQWKHVYIEQEGFNRQEEFDESYLRWLYTAFTRASETVFLVNFRDRFFDETQHQ
jgi:exodeoxyribonuclease-5